MADKFKVSVGVVFSPKILDFDVEGSPETLVEEVQKSIADGASQLTFTSADGTRVIVPGDKLAYVEIHSKDKSSSIGFGT